MLDLFRRPRTQEQAGPEGPGETTHRSHVFPKLLRRLSLIEKPTVLDLGRLSGANIEILARLGCRVQVDDLVMAADERARGTAGPEPVPAADVAAEPAPPPSEAPAALACAPGAAPAAPQATDAAAVPGTLPAGGATTPSNGGRPSRRIVLPPRYAARTSNAPGAGAATRAARPEPTPLSAGFAYADASFDAILAWDLINYYDPMAARRLAGEMSRILRPGGIVYGWLHSRSVGATDGPRRFRVVNEAHLSEAAFTGRPLHRHLYQNRDIEKMFVDLRIAEMYFLKSGIREMLLEKRTPGSAPPPGTPAARPRPRFRIE